MSIKPKNPMSVPPSVQRQIDENLRLIYGAKLTEDIPDHLQDLLKQLRAQDTPR